MNPEQKRIVKTTWHQVVPIADTAARLFYERLFEIDPTTRPLFRQTDMTAQGVKLIQAIGLVVGGLDRLGALVPVLEDLGRRHSGYGVADRHYDSVASALLWTLEQGLGPAWTPEARAAWTVAYGLVAGTMRRAADEAEALRGAA